jgi:catechol 2,3-dioxygenase-like lactoylglutathione lyase family enzyme
MKTRLAVISLWSDNVAKTIHFYKDVIGLTLSHHGASRPHFDLGSCFLVILEGHPIKSSDASSERFPLLAFAVDNLDNAINELQAHQIEMPWGIEHDQHSRWTMIEDPGGNLIELVQFGEQLGFR